MSRICWLLLISIFDWPEHTHTSPIRIFSSTMVFALPLMVIVNGPPAAGVVIFTFHFPLLGAITVSIFVFHELLIVNRSLGSDQPQSVACEFCCSTMLLLMIGDNRMNASNFAGHAMITITVNSRINFFIATVFILEVY